MTVPKYDITKIDAAQAVEEIEKVPSTPYHPEPRKVKGEVKVKLYDPEWIVWRKLKRMVKRGT